MLQNHSNKSSTKIKNSTQKSTTSNKNIRIINVRKASISKQTVEKEQSHLILGDSDNHSSSSDEIHTPSCNDEEVPYPDLDSDCEPTPSKPVFRDELEKKLVLENPTVASSPVLLPHERKQAREFGYSLDTKLMNDEFFYVDLEKM
jgi:flagellar biogenesis protein FliO